MNKLAVCFLLHGAPSAQSFKSYHVQRSPSLQSLERRPFSMPRRRTADHAATIAKATILDVATIAPHANTQGADVAATSGTSFDFEHYLSTNARAVHVALDLALQGLGCPELLSKSVRYSILAGGKRLRPALAIAACELVGGSAATALPVACAVEMIHTASLIHDDMPCMDDGALRRGQPSIHVAFGEPTALLAGDALLALAFEHVARGCADAGITADRALRAVLELGSAAGVGGIAAGQVADMASEGAPLGFVSLASLEYIHVHKTARLMEAAAVSGAVVGGGGDAEVERIRRYAHFLGLLHQVLDDMLDVTATSEQLGKAVGMDAAAGKATYPRLMGMNRARAYMGELLVKAEAELDGFNAARTAPLLHLARFMGMAYRHS